MSLSHVAFLCVHCLPSEEAKHESVLILFVTLLCKIFFFINTENNFQSQVEYICEPSFSTTVGLADRDCIRLVWCKPCNFHQHVWCLYCACVIKSVCNHLRFQLHAGRLTVSEHEDRTSSRNYFATTSISMDLFWQFPSKYTPQNQQSSIMLYVRNIHYQIQTWNCSMAFY